MISSKRFIEQVGFATRLIQSYTVYLIVLIYLVPPTTTQWASSDPILKILPPNITLWGIVVYSIFLAFFYRVTIRSNRTMCRRAFLECIGGFTTAIGITLAIRILNGPEFPSFIPSEESAKPGFLLGMAAGLSEELIFRLTLTPLLFFLLRRRMRYHSAIWLTICLVAIGFAGLHEWGSSVIHFNHFITRFIIPGVAMGTLFFYRDPIFLVSLHCAAHIVIPLLFK